MLTNNLLPKALFISLTLHTVFICSSFLLNHDAQQKKEKIKKRVEISYRAPHKKTPDVQQHPIKPAQQLDLNNNLPPSMNGGVPVKLVKDNQLLPAQFMYEHKPERMTHGMSMVRKVTITPIISEKINNPIYAAYSDIVRSRIEEKVNDNYDKSGKGLVYLTFIVDANGVLKIAQVIPEKTTASQHLQDISLRSLRESSPFPPFLKGMSLPEYTFNIEVQYQLHD